MSEPTFLSDAHQRTLAALADAIIPASAAHGIPGAGDPAIAAEIASDAAKRSHPLASALTKVDALADQAHSQAFADLAPAARSAVAETFRAQEPDLALMVGNLVAQCYYRDERVMRSIGMEVRPPFPKGYEIEQGDWSLLDPVRQREPFHRPT